VGNGRTEPAEHTAGLSVEGNLHLGDGNRENCAPDDVALQVTVGGEQQQQPVGVEQHQPLNRDTSTAPTCTECASARCAGDTGTPRSPATLLTEGQRRRPEWEPALLGSRSGHGRRHRRRMVPHRASTKPPPVPWSWEEACATDPTLVQGVRAPQVWRVDLLDGTANFVESGHDWAVMVALCEEGRTVAPWISQPTSLTMYTAEAGCGPARHGRAVTVAPRPSELAWLRGAVLTRCLPASASASIDAARDLFDTVTPQALRRDRLSGRGRRREDFMLFWRTLPWDHAPEVPLLQEAGGVAERPDTSPYLQPTRVPAYSPPSTARPGTRYASSSRRQRCRTTSSARYVSLPREQETPGSSADNDVAGEQQHLRRCLIRSALSTWSSEPDALHLVLCPPRCDECRRVWRWRRLASHVRPRRGRLPVPR